MAPRLYISLRSMKLSFTEQDILEHGVAEIIGMEDLRARIKAGKKLQVKLGIDPTSPNIHLGRSTVLWRLRAFQELGHDIHFLIGDFTGQVGDTSDKDAERPMLSEETVKENLATYLDQAWMILNPAKKDQVHIHYNSEWLEGLSLGRISFMADAFSVNQFIKRELVAKRLESGSRISLREMLYPLMQGYDSVVLKADVELGGTDQRFNMLAGRTLQEQAGQPPQAVIMGTLISGTDGRKMSSSWGNVISLMDTPGDKFGKLMAVRDDIMGEYLLAMPISAQPFTAEALASRLAAGENPRNLKMELGQALVALYHGEAVAAAVKAAFIAQFSEGQKPTDIPELSLASLEIQNLLEALTAASLASSKTEARRLLEQRGVKVNDEVVQDPATALKPGDLLQVGKRHFLKLIA